MSEILKLYILLVSRTSIIQNYCSISMNFLFTIYEQTRDNCRPFRGRSPAVCSKGIPLYGSAKTRGDKFIHHTNWRTLSSFLTVVPARQSLWRVRDNVPLRKRDLCPIMNYSVLEPPYARNFISEFLPVICHLSRPDTYFSQMRWGRLKIFFIFCKPHLCRQRLS